MRSNGTHRSLRTRGQYQNTARSPRNAHRPEYHTRLRASVDTALQPLSMLRISPICCPLVILQYNGEAQNRIQPHSIRLRSARSIRAERFFARTEQKRRHGRAEHCNATRSNRYFSASSSTPTAKSSSDSFPKTSSRASWWPWWRCPFPSRWPSLRA